MLIQTNHLVAHMPPFRPTCVLATIGAVALLASSAVGSGGDGSHGGDNQGGGNATLPEVRMPRRKRDRTDESELHDTKMLCNSWYEVAEAARKKVLTEKNLELITLMYIYTCIYIYTYIDI